MRTKKEENKINLEVEINNRIWVVYEIIKDVKTEKDAEGVLFRSADKKTLLSEFYSEEEKVSYFKSIEADLKEGERVVVLADNNSVWILDKLMDDLTYFQERAKREEIRRRN